MKAILTLLGLIASATSFASTFPLTPETSVVKVELLTSYAHNCPSKLDLVVKAQGDGVYVIDTDTKVFQEVKRLRSQVSNSCSEEIGEIIVRDMNGPVCLSIGHSQGEVMISIPKDSELSEISLSVPAGLRIKKVTQLKNVVEQVLDCENPPSINCCMAEIPSCIACRERSRSVMNAWADACMID